MSYIEQIDEFIKNGELDKARELCEKYEKAEAVQLRIIKILTLEQKYEEAEKICYNYPRSFEIQKSLINILITEGRKNEEKYEVAKKVCKKYMDDNVDIKVKYVKILILQEKYEEAEQLCKEHPDNLKMISQLIKIYMNNNKLEEAKKLCEDNLECDAIKSQYVTILLSEGNTEKAKEICRKYPENPVLQSQLISILISENKFVEAKKIAMENKASESEAIKSQLRIINKNLKKRNKKEINEEEIPYINIIKTRIYMDDIPKEFIDEIKNGDLDDWQKMILLIAIYKKKNENGNVEKTYREARKMFKADPIKTKKLNTLNGYLSSNKTKVFEWKMFDSVISWQISKEYVEKIQSRREIEQKELEARELENKKEVLEKATQKESKPDLEEVKIEMQETERPKVEIRQKEEKKEIQNVPNYIPKSKKIKNKEKGKSKKEIQKESITMDEKFRSEITKLKAKIGSKANLSDINYIKEFNMVENIEDRPSKELRAKMQLVMYLRKYGLDKEAREALPQECEVYDLINKMMLYKRADSRYDDTRILEEIFDKVSKIDGDNEYIYKLLDNSR